MVGEVNDAAGAIRSSAELRPDCVVLDLSMPGMDGLEAIPLIGEASPAPAIVVFSNFSFEPVGPAVLKAGAAAYVQKRVTNWRLRQTILDVCRSRAVPR